MNSVHCQRQLMKIKAIAHSMSIGHEDIEGTKRNLTSCSSPNKTVQQQLSKSSRKRSVYFRLSVKAAGIVAANKLVWKAIYCIDNIDVSFSAEDIVEYVSNIGITVLSCFEAKPRLRRSDNYTNDCKAFRLFINNDHREKLLDSSNNYWQDSNVVSVWFFESQQPSKRSRDVPDDIHLRAESPAEPSFHYRHLERECFSQRNDGNVLIVDNGTIHSVFIQADNHAIDMDLTIITQDSNNPI